MPSSASYCIEVFFPAEFCPGKELQMKKIYLVKKDPKQPAGEGNWNMLNGYEFAKFLETEEGSLRKGNFSRIDGADNNDIIIIVESDPVTALEDDRARMLANFRAKRNEKIGYRTVSYFGIPDEDSQFDAEDNIPDDETNVEDAVIRSLEIEALVQAIKLLPEKDQILIEEMFLKDRLTEQKYAQKHGISQKGANKRKNAALNRLKKILEDNEYKKFFFESNSFN